MADRSSRPHHSPTKTLPALPAGSLIHVDVTKFGNIPDGGGHRYVGRQQGERNKRATPGLPHGADYRPRTGTAFVHTVIDDHSRVAYAEIHTDVTAAATAVLRRAVAWLTGHGVTVERVLSDNGSACRSHAWRDTCTELGNPALRPQTNGKIERFHRSLAEGWAPSSATGLAALLYNHHRPHSSTGGKPPVTRLTNRPGLTSNPGRPEGVLRALRASAAGS